MSILIRQAAGPFRRLTREPFPDEKLLHGVFESLVEPHLIQPTFVIDYPLGLCPLAKTKAGDPRTAERFGR